MKNFNRQKHWNKIYSTKALEEVSWYQSNPEIPLKMIKKYNVKKKSPILDAGGGDSFLVDNLLELGYEDISIIDISDKAIERAQHRLGAKAKNVNWIIQDVVSFHSSKKYDFWHDRAVFHFLTDEKGIEKYINTISKYLNLNGILMIGTFSVDGPKKCSGIDTAQYSEETLNELIVNKGFELLENFRENHKTPFNTTQNFVFGIYKKN